MSQRSQRSRKSRPAVGLVTLLLTGLLAGVLAGCGGGADGRTASPARQPDGRLTVDVLYLNHGPVQEVLGEVDKILAGQSGKIVVKRHDAETPAGKEFARAHGLQGHVPIAVLIGGKTEANVGGRAVSFKGFPKGRSPIAAAEGNWTLDDLKGALRQRTGQG
jgi:hypothetical protein